jgi:hypothetical protein
VSKANVLPPVMRAILGSDNFRDVETIVHRLCELELRGAISSEWHAHIIESLADELVTQQIANDVASEALTEPAACPDAHATEVR